jgi:hypothetical protein
MTTSSDRVPLRRGWPWPDGEAANAEPARRSEMNLQAEVALLAIEAIRLANELGATVRRLEEVQFELDLAGDARSLDIARAAIRRAGGDTPH